MVVGNFFRLTRKNFHNLNRRLKSLLDFCSVLLDNRDNYAIRLMTFGV